MIFAIINDEETTYSIKELWQYDYGQVLRIQNLNTEKYAIEIHFSTEENFGESITRIATNNGGSFDVTIPDSVLENKCASKDYFIYAFIYITGQSSGNTIKKIIIPVRSRPKPEGREQNDNNTMTAILKAVNSIADGKADGLKYEDNILKLLSGENILASVEIKRGSVGTGREIELQNDGIYIQWRYAGDESWTNLIALEDIKGPAGQAGEKGDPGTITPEQISGAVEEYFASNPIQVGATEEQARQIEKNTQDISKLSDDIANQSGITTNHANTLWAILQKTKFYEQVTTEELNAFKNAWGIESSGGSEEGGGDTPTVTYTVTRNLVGCTSNSNVTEIREGSTLNETLTTNEGYTLPTAVQGGSISITMGGTDITSNVYNYNTGVINISSVTGNVVINVECVNEAALPTNGLDDYFDLRNAELVDLGSYKSYKATVGNGAIFGNANENIATNDKGMLYARYNYSTQGDASWNDYPMPFTFASLTHSMAYKGSSPYMPNNMFKFANNQWNLCPTYNNSSGSTTQLGNIPQGSLTEGYHTFFITAKDKVLKFYLNGNLIQTCNGDDHSDFVSWKSFQILACLQYTVDRATAFATWNRVLTENELNEVERYFRTLEME